MIDNSRYNVRYTVLTKEIRFLKQKISHTYENDLNLRVVVQYNH